MTAYDDPTESLMDNINRSNKELTNTSPPFFSAIEVNRMFIEPEENIYSKLFNRNLQMGYIAREDQPIQQLKWETAKLLADIPPSQGQFLFGWMAGINVDSINFKFVSSNSVDGKGRLSMLTRVVRQINKDETQKPSVAAFLGAKSDQTT